MPKRIAGTESRVGTRRREPAECIDVTRHKDGLVVAAAEVTTLVERLTQGKAILEDMSAESENRAEGERLWADLCIQLHTAMREVYARFALLRIAIGNEAALALWDAHLPTGDALAAIGTADMIAYWRGRVENPEWLTHQEAQFITRSLWPPRGTDPISRGVLEMIDEPPFD